MSRESEIEPEDEAAEECSYCNKRKKSVSTRPNGYARDVNNDPTAKYTVCDECDYQSNMDI